MEANARFEIARIVDVRRLDGAADAALHHRLLKLVEGHELACLLLSWRWEAFLKACVVVLVELLVAVVLHVWRGWSEGGWGYGGVVHVGCGLLVLLFVEFEHDFVAEAALGIADVAFAQLELTFAVDLTLVPCHTHQTTITVIQIRIRILQNSKPQPRPIRPARPYTSSRGGRA